MFEGLWGFYCPQIRCLSILRQITMFQKLLKCFVVFHNDLQYINFCTKKCVVLENLLLPFNYENITFYSCKITRYDIYL